MVEIEGIRIPIVADTSGVAEGFEQAKQGLADFGNEAEDAGKKAKTSMQTFGTEAESAGKKVKASATSMDGSFKGLALGMSQTMTSAFSLYQSFDNIEKKQYALDKANLALTRSNEDLKKAQEDYNLAVDKYGESSTQAQDALAKLTIAQDANSLAADRVKLAQSSVNDSMLMAGMTIIPGVVSGIDGLAKMWKNFSGMNFTDSLGKLKTGLSNLGTNKMGLLAGVGAGIGAMSMAFLAFQEKSPAIKAAYALVAGGLVMLASAQWILNIAKVFGYGPAALAAVAIGGAAAAATYALSTMYGAKPEEAAPNGGMPGEIPVPAPTPAPGPSGTSEGGGEQGEPSTEMPTSAGTAGMTGEEMAAAGLGTYVQGVFMPNEAALIKDDIAFRASLGPNKGKYKWTREGPAKGKWFSMDELARIRSGAFVADYEEEMRPWFVWGFGERTDSVGNVWLQGKHFQQGGWALTPQLAIVGEKPEVVLTESHLDILAARLAGGGSTRTVNVTQHFHIDGARDVDYIMDQIARRLRETGGQFL